MNTSIRFHLTDADGKELKNFFICNSFQVSECLVRLVLAQATGKIRIDGNQGTHI
jgi:hypothetical protein